MAVKSPDDVQAPGERVWWGRGSARARGLHFAAVSNFESRSTSHRPPGGQGGCAVRTRRRGIMENAPIAPGVGCARGDARCHLRKLEMGVLFFISSQAATLQEYTEPSGPASGLLSSAAIEWQMAMASEHSGVMTIGFNFMASW